MQIPLSWLISLVLLGPCYVPDHVSAHRIILSPQQKLQLQRVEKIFVNALALTEKGLVAPAIIQQAVSDQLAAIGFTIVATQTEPHDVVLKVKCEEQKPWGGVKKSDGDIHRPGSPSRNWKGPACQLSYFFDDQKGPWQYEVRTAFENAWESARSNRQKDSGLFALRPLCQALRESSCALDLAAEWQQARLLSSLLIDSKTDQAIKIKILSLAGRVPGHTMLEALQRLIAQAELTLPATVALGSMGEPAIPTLMNLLSDRLSSVEIQAAAAEGLGEIGAHSGNVKIVPPLLAMMQSPDVPIRVQTEIVKAIGKTPDQRSVEPLQQLGLKAWTARSNDPLMQELREAIDLSLWQIKPTAHTDE